MAKAQRAQSVHRRQPKSPSRPRPEGLLNIGTVAELFNVHPNTIRRATETGALKCYKLPSGHRRFAKADVCRWLGVEPNAQQDDGESKVALLARVSSNKQGTGFDIASGEAAKESDLSRQVERLREYALEHYQTPGKLYADVGSGLSFTRKQFLRLVDDLLAGKYRGGVVLVTYKDRLCRWGQELVERIAHAGGAEIKYIEDEPEKTDQQELVEDLLALTTIFSARLHGRRAAKTLRVEIPADTLRYAKKLYDAGHPITDVVNRLNAENRRCAKGNKISYYVLHRHLVTDAKLLDAVLPEGEAEKNSWQEFAEQHLVQGDPKARLRTSAIYEAYSKWCIERGITPIKKRTVGTWLRQKYTWKYTRTGHISYVGLALV